jgi:hypothetical protein
MWQPGRAQWTIICLTAALLVLAWPPSAGRSLGSTFAGWAVDPGHTLPTLPPPLPMGLDDDGDAVTEHDLRESAYYHAREQSAMTRLRMDLRDASGPLQPTTERQLLVAVAVAAALVVWRLEGAREREGIR